MFSISIFKTILLTFCMFNPLLKLGFHILAQALRQLGQENETSFRNSHT